MLGRSLQIPCHTIHSTCAVSEDSTGTSHAQRKPRACSHVIIESLCSEERMWHPVSCNTLLPTPLLPTPLLDPRVPYWICCKGNLYCQFYSMGNRASQRHAQPDMTTPLVSPDHAPNRQTLYTSNGAWANSAVIWLTSHHTRTGSKFLDKAPVRISTFLYGWHCCPGTALLFCPESDMQRTVDWLTQDNWDTWDGLLGGFLPPLLSTTTHLILYPLFPNWSTSCHY